jgi:hypothetical protein
MRRRLIIRRENLAAKIFTLPNFADVTSGRIDASCQGKSEHRTFAIWALFLALERYLLAYLRECPRLPWCGTLPARLFRP